MPCLSKSRTSSHTLNPLSGRERKRGLASCLGAQAHCKEPGTENWCWLGPVTHIPSWDCSNQPTTRSGPLVKFLSAFLPHQADCTFGGFCGGGLWMQEVALLWLGTWSCGKRLEGWSAPSGGGVQRLRRQLYHKAPEGGCNQRRRPRGKQLKLCTTQQKGAVTGSGWRGKIPSGLLGDHESQPWDTNPGLIRPWSAYLNWWCLMMKGRNTWWRWGAQLCCIGSYIWWSPQKQLDSGK